MATANGSGTPAPQEDDDPERTQRIPAVQKVVDEWFSDDPKPTTNEMRVFNRTARRMRQQHAQGQPTTGRRGCPFTALAPIAVAVLLVRAVTR